MFRTIRLKLTMIAVIPLIFALSLAGRWVASSYCTYSQMNVLERHVQLAGHASRYLHETQKERGATGVFVGSGGVVFHDRLLEQRALTDSARATFEESLASCDSRVLGSEFDRVRAAMRAQMKLADEIRIKIDRQLMTATEAIGFYTEHNAAVLGVISVITGISKMNEDAEFAWAAAAYEDFLQAKERAGIERAVLCVAFAADRFEPGAYQELETLVTEQEIFLESFRKRASPEQVALYDRLLADPVMEQVQRMRVIAFGAVASDPRIVAMEAQLNLSMAWQSLTEISVTRARDGLDVGFDEAEKHAVLFRQRLAELSAIVPDEEEMLRGAVVSFEAFYAEALKHLKEGKVRDLFTFLRAEERRHADLFERILGGLTDQPTGTWRQDEEYVTYLRALVGNHVFPDPKTARGAVAALQDEATAILQALSFEKDSILFFHELRPALAEENHKVIDALIDEERKHVRALHDALAQL